MDEHADQSMVDHSSWGSENENHDDRDSIDTGINKLCWQLRTMFEGILPQPGLGGEDPAFMIHVGTLTHDKGYCAEGIRASIQGSTVPRSIQYRTKGKWVLPEDSESLDWPPVAGVEAATVLTAWLSLFIVQAPPAILLMDFYEVYTERCSLTIFLRSKFLSCLCGVFMFYLWLELSQVLQFAHTNGVSSSSRLVGALKGTRGRIKWGLDGWHKLKVLKGLFLGCVSQR